MAEPTSADRIRSWNAEVAIILASGLNAVVTSPLRSMSYAEFRDIPQPTVSGHDGNFSLCDVAGVCAIFAQGRVHLYEGRGAREVSAVIRILMGAGVKRLIITNTAGGLSLQFKPGDWMMITDHLNLTGTSPLIGSANFLDMSDAYSNRMRNVFSSAAKKIGMPLREGVYAAVLGPQYETPAEVKMLQRLGADAIGMSTVLEVIQARALSIEVAGFSCITNFAAGISPAKLFHEEVLATGQIAAKDFSRLLAAALPQL